MKVEFEIRDNYVLFQPFTKMQDILTVFAKMLLVTMDETIYNVKIDGGDINVY